MKYGVCAREALQPGSMLPVTVGRKRLVVGRTVDGEYFALADRCPHQGAPLSAGRLWGLMGAQGIGRYVYGRKGEILRCPWHGMEFDVKDGKGLVDRDRCAVKRYPVTIEDGVVTVQL